MNVTKARYTILTPISEGALNELQFIESIGRVCYKSEDKITEDGESAKKFIRNLIKNGHEAMIEHSSLSVMFTVDRGVTHELVRHRIASFAQESTRYCNYSNDKFGNECNFIDLEPGLTIDTGINLNRTGKIVDATRIGNILDEWRAAMEDAERHYLKMLELGARPQIARSVLPNSTKSDITITANYREWRAFFKLRADAPAHPQMREVTIPLLHDLQERIPVIFEDINF
ncbi:MAG: FAD-dependent thymidylate synthase [Lachnospiraceae bacterium]|nr:FAD-dependent thymidylate synthase [Lachnospiraceae bacterium]